MNGKSATFLILVIAAVVLGCFAVKSYYEYQVTKIKLEHGIEVEGAPVAGQTGAGAGGATSAAGGTSVVVPPPPGIGTAPIATTPASAIVQAPVAGGGSTITSVAPLARDPAAEAEAERIKQDLAALRTENEIYRKKYDQLQGGVEAAAAAAGGASTGESASAIPGATAAGAPGVASDDPEVLALRQRIIDAQAIAKVAQTDWNFDLVVIDGGSDRNIQKGDTFAVRRGNEIMGYLKVDEAEPSLSMTTLTSENRESQTARRPEPGDDVIKWPLF